MVVLTANAVERKFYDAVVYKVPSATCHTGVYLSDESFMYDSGLLENKEAILLRDEMLRILDAWGITMNKADSKLCGR